MRSAAVSRAFEQLRKNSARPSRITSIEYSGVAGLVDGEVKFSAPITAICGLNGVGKSALLSILRRALVTEVEGATAISKYDRIGKGNISIDLLYNGQQVKIEISNGTVSIRPEKMPNAVFIDAPAEAIEQFKFFKRDLESIDDAINGIDPEQFSAVDLEMLSYITGKAYDAVEIYDLEAFEPLRIYIKVRDRGVDYDIRTMSLGEISCALLVRAIKRSQKNSIIMIEEPETYISPSAQAYMMDFLVAQSGDKKISFVIATHSPKLIQNLNHDEIIILYQTQHGSRIADRATYGAYLRNIGLQSKKIPVMIVEDRLGKEFSKFILQKFDLSLLLDAEIIAVGGEDKITKIREYIPTKSQKITLIGIYDGDQRAGLPALENICPAVFLPGDEPMEASLKRMAFIDPARASKFLQVTEDAFSIANEIHRGKNPHDWLYDIAKSLGLTFEFTLRGLLEAWIEDDSNKAAVDLFLEEVREKIV